MSTMRNDEDIKKVITDSMYWDERVDFSKVNAIVKNGVVTLTGSVPSEEAKQAAFEDAHFIEGVIAVIDKLHVQEPSDAQKQIIFTDKTIQEQIKSHIKLDSDAFFDKGDEINITVMNGWVTLSGIVDAYWKRERARNHVYRVSQVLGLTNKLAVVPTEKQSDESIAMRVVDAIDRNSNVSLRDIIVKVANGKVVLTGMVPTQKAKEAAYNSAFYTAGVVAVDNQLQVIN